MDELTERFDELRATVEPHVHQPAFGVIEARHRRRVRNQRIAASGTMALLVLAGYGLVTRADDQRNVGPISTLAAEGYVPPPTGEFAARDVAFVDDARGWALGSRCSKDGEVERCTMGISRTTDGGDTWTPPVRFGPLVDKHDLRTSFDPRTGAARSIRFIDETTGYAFNPGLYVTTDAGVSWSPLPVTAQVAGVSASPAGPLVVTRDCPREGACSIQLLGGAGTLAPLPAQPPTVGWSVSLRVSGDDLWVHSYGAREQRIARSTDRGKSWTTVPSPCKTWVYQHFSVSGSTLWVACTVSDVENDRVGVKQVYVSPDAGESWVLRGSPPKKGVTNDLKAVSADEAFLSSSHGDLLRTTDGGRTWSSVVGNGGYINLEFLDPSRGWFFGPEGALWRYRDGETQRLTGPR